MKDEIEAYNILLSHFDNTSENNISDTNNFDFQTLQMVPENQTMEMETDKKIIIEPIETGKKIIIEPSETGKKIITIIRPNPTIDNKPTTYNKPTYNKPKYRPPNKQKKKRDFQYHQH